MVVRDQRLTAREFADVGGRFGILERTALNARQADYARAFRPERTEDSMLYVHPDIPDVYVMSNERRPDLIAVGVIDAAGAWHSDGSHASEPTQAIALHAIRNPSCGGETDFCNMALLYDELSSSVRAQLDGRWAIHHWSKTKNPLMGSVLDPATREEYERVERFAPFARHPLVRTHPETGRRSLYMSPRFTIEIEGLEPDTSQLVLHLLRDMIEEERFRYKHVWRDGDVLLWDNRCLIHRACGGYAEHEKREMYRATLRGDVPYYEPSGN